MSTFKLVPVSNWGLEQSGSAIADPGPDRDDSIASEVPVAMTYNRISHVVMMATPADLEDFALGFSLTEGLIGSVDDLLATYVIPRVGGIELAMVRNGRKNTVHSPAGKRNCWTKRVPERF